MRAFLTLTAGTVGACLVTAAGLTTALFAFAGRALDLAVAAFTLATWSLGFGLAFLVIAFVGHASGVLEPTTPHNEGSLDV